MAIVATIEHKSQHIQTSGDDGHLWRIDLYDNTTGSDVVYNMVFAYNAIDITHQGQSKNLFQRIIPTQVKFKIMMRDATDEALLATIISGDENRFYIKLYRDDILEFSGFLLRDQITIEDKYYPYAVTLEATDGLNLLSQYDYKDIDDTAYSGPDTFISHLLKVLKVIYVDELYAAGDVYLSTSVNFYENNMGDLLGDPLAQSRVDHSAFTEFKDRTYYELDFINIPLFGAPELRPVTVTEAVNFTNCAEVLEAILTLFNARIVHEQGSYHVVSINNYAQSSYRLFEYNKAGTETRRATFSHNITVDDVYTFCETGRTYTFLQPVKRVVVDYELGHARNIIAGMVWNNEVVGELCDGTIIDHTVGASLDVNIPIELWIRDANFNIFWPKFRLLFKISLRVSGSYLDRSYDGLDESGNPIYGEVTWDPSIGAYYVCSDEITILNSYNAVVNVALETPPIIQSGGTCLKIELVQVFNSYQTFPLDGIFSINWGTYLGTNNYKFYWGYSVTKGYIKILSDNTDVNEDARTFIRYTADVALRNTEVIEVKSPLGDDPGTQNPRRLQYYDGAAWLDSSSWFKLGNANDKPIGELLAYSMAEMRADLLKVMRGSFICKERRIYPSTRLTTQGYTYSLLLGAYNSEIETMRNSEWIAVQLAPGKTTSKSSNKIAEITPDKSAKSNRDPLNPYNIINNNSIITYGGYKNYKEYTGADAVANKISILDSDPLPNPQDQTNKEINKKVSVQLNGVELSHGDYTLGRRYYTIDEDTLSAIYIMNLRNDDIIKIRYN